MTRSILACSAVVVMMSAVPGSASAQSAPQQTADGAQEFMNKVLSNGSTSIEIPLLNNTLNYVEMSRHHSDTKCYPMLGCKQETSTSYYHDTLSPFPTTSAKKISECATTFNFQNPGDSDISTYVPTSVTIYWNNVTKAEASGNSVYLSGARVKLHFSSDDLATRFAYAATFMQTKCDSTAGTGF